MIYASTDRSERRTIGFVISGKPNERRRAMLPKDLPAVRHRDVLVFEAGYGAPFGIDDDVYRAAGSTVACAEAVYACDIICNPKAPEASERARFHSGQTLFGWVHAVQGRATVDFLLERAMTAIAWEDMFEQGRHCFWRNNEIAGEASVFHAINFLGRLPMGAAAAVIGTGNCARGAMRALAQLGATVRVYDQESVAALRDELPMYDLVVNAVAWDVFRTDHLIYRDDLARMKRDSMIIDISCDEEMGIESSRPTTITDPVYAVGGVLHYAVDHAPALYFKSASESISLAVARHLDALAEGRPTECLTRATVIERGRIVDGRIARFQQRQM